MIRIFITAYFLMFLGNALAQNRESDFRSELVGSWLAAEFFIPQPPKELQQDIKDITFQENGVVRWSVVKDGKIEKLSGFYAILPNAQSMRKLPYVHVAPSKAAAAQMSDNPLLLFENVSIGLDSRFHVESVGKVLKARNAHGEPLVFVRKKQDGQQDGADQPATALELKPEGNEKPQQQSKDRSR